MKVSRNPKTIVIEPDKQGDLNCWYDKEIITLRIASKQLECHECHNPILKNEKYIRDKFIFSGNFSEVQYKTNNICLKCWKGEIPPLIVNNRKLQTNIDNGESQ